MANRGLQLLEFTPKEIPGTDLSPIGGLFEDLGLLVQRKRAQRQAEEQAEVRRRDTLNRANAQRTAQEQTQDQGIRTLDTLEDQPTGEVAANETNKQFDGLAGLDPGLATEVTEALRSGDADTINALNKEASDSVLVGESIQKLPTHAAKLNMWRKHIVRQNLQGEELTEALNIMNASPDDFDTAMIRGQAVGGAVLALLPDTNQLAEKAQRGQRRQAQRRERQQAADANLAELSTFDPEASERTLRSRERRNIRLETRREKRAARRTAAEQEAFERRQTSAGAIPKGFQRIDPDRPRAGVERIAGAPESGFRTLTESEQKQFNLPQGGQINQETGRIHPFPSLPGLKFSVDGTKIGFESGVNLPPGLQGLTGSDASKRVRELSEKRVSTLTAIDGAGRLKEKVLEEGANIVGVVGGATRLVNSISAQARGAAEAFGLPDLSPENFNFSAFPEAAAKSAAFKSNLISLAFATASAREAGKLTNKDIQAAIDTYGAASGSPVQIVAAIDEAIIGMKRGYQIRHFDVTGEQFAFPSDLAEVGVTEEVDADLEALLDKFAPLE